MSGKSTAKKEKIAASGNGSIINNEMNVMKWNSLNECQEANAVN